jgi:MFS family permease
MIVCGPAAGWLGTRYGHAIALRIGLAAGASALSLLAFAHEDPALALVWMGLLGVGLAFALAVGRRRRPGRLRAALSPA